MLVVGLNPGHDGAIAAVGDRKLLWSLESEKDSFLRHARLSPASLLGLTEQLDAVPDVIALGGWYRHPFLGEPYIGAGYEGDQNVQRPANFLGRPVTFFSSSHERSHIAMSVGMAPPNESPQHAVLVWEGTLGHFYLLDDRWAVKERIPVLNSPGNRFSLLYGIADPTFPDRGFPRIEDAGKLMALAAYADPDDADPAIADTVERVLNVTTLTAKGEFKDSPVYNAELESEQTKTAAALLTRRIFGKFSRAAQARLPEGLPLYISGGCGLNCDWNTQWRELGHFSSVFVPPCANDSGSALGTAIDALITLSGDPHIDWSVYSGLEFEWDRDPDPARWERRPLDNDALADAIAGGRIVGWVQGRWEIGPRAPWERARSSRSPSTRAPATVSTRSSNVRASGRSRPAAGWRTRAASSTPTSTTPTCSYFRMVRPPISERSRTWTAPRVRRRSRRRPTSRSTICCPPSPTATVSACSATPH